MLLEPQLTAKFWRDNGNIRYSSFSPELNNKLFYSITGIIGIYYNQKHELLHCLENPLLKYYETYHHDY